MQSKSARDIWLAFLECRSTVYVGYSNKTRSNGEARITSDLFRDFVEVNGIEMQLSPMEAHNVIGIEEGYHLIYTTVRKSYPNLNARLVVQFSIKPINYKMVPRELVLSLVLFGVVTSLPARKNTLPDQMERMAALTRSKKSVRAGARTSLLLLVDFNFINRCNGISEGNQDI